jgi:hypothetical protein
MDNAAKKKRRNPMNEEQGLFPMVAEADNHDVVGTTRTRKQRFKPYDQQQTYLLRKRQNKHRLP